MFALNNETGELFPIRRIDAEESDLYNLMVVARDGHSPYNSATASILIIVYDVNDNAPHFDASLFTASINETREGETTIEQYVTTLGITDVDRGVNNSKLIISVYFQISFIFIKELITYLLDQVIIVLWIAKILQLNSLW